MREAVLREHERLDDLMRSGRKIIQDTREFCFSLDAVLLAHFPHYRSRQRVLELGTATMISPRRSGKWTIAKRPPNFNA